MRFRKIFEHAPFGAAIADREWEALFWPIMRFAICLAIHKQEMQRMHFADITHEEDVDVDIERFRQLVDGNIDHYNLEKRYRTKQDKRNLGKHGSDTLIPGKNSQEAVLSSDMVEDISERKRAEQKIIQVQG